MPEEQISAEQLVQLRELTHKSLNKIEEMLKGTEFEDEVMTWSKVLKMTVPAMFFLANDTHQENVGMHLRLFLDGYYDIREEEAPWDYGDDEDDCEEESEETPEDDT